MKSAILFLILVTCAGAVPTITAIGTGGTFSTVSSTTVTTTATCSAGSSVVVAIGYTGASLFTLNVTDTASNSYTTSAGFIGGTNTPLYTSSAVNIANLASGATITVSFSTAANQPAVHAMCIAGVASSPLDVNASTAGSFGSSWATNAFTTAAASESILVFVINSSFGSVASVTTPGYSLVSATASFQFMSTFGAVVSSIQTAATVAGTFTSSGNNSEIVMSLKAPAGSPSQISRHRVFIQ